MKCFNLTIYCQVTTTPVQELSLASCSVQATADGPQSCLSSPALLWPPAQATPAEQVGKGRKVTAAGTARALPSEHTKLQKRSLKFKSSWIGAVFHWKPSRNTSSADHPQLCFPSCPTSSWGSSMAPAPCLDGCGCKSCGVGLLFI